MIDSYYIGSTSNLEERLRKHNFKHKGYTSRVHDWRIVYYEVFQTKQEAMRRELQVKAWKNKIRIKALVQQAGQSIPTYNVGRVARYNRDGTT